MPKKLTVMIDESLDQQLELIAKASGLTKSKVVEQALKAYVEGSIISEETLSKVDAACIWEAIKILKALAKLITELQEAWMLSEIKVKKKWLYTEMLHSARFLKVVKKAAKRVKEIEEEGEEKGGKTSILEEFAVGLLAGLAERLGILEEAGAGIEEGASVKSRREEKAEEEEKTEAGATVEG